MATTDKSLQIQKRLALAMLVVGLLGQTMMTIFEDEPGAIPVGMILIGALWYGVTRVRARPREV